MAKKNFIPGISVQHKKSGPEESPLSYIEKIDNEYLNNL